jgi:hypothetical protein
MECRAKPRIAGHPPQSPDGRDITRPAPLGPHPVLVQRSKGGGRKPIDGFFEWKAIKGEKAKQPYAIAMKDGAPFGIAGIWENWKEPGSGEWIRTFAIITTDANELVDICNHHHRCQ